MEQTPNLALPYILAAQAQKHVTHNEAIRALDALVQIGIADRNLTTPPSVPADGRRYIVANGGGGDWTGHDGKIAAWQDGAWAFYPPQAGWLAWIEDEAALVVWDGSGWIAAGTGSGGGGGSGGSVNPTPLVGVNATADTINRLSVASDAVLLSHDDVTPGSGDQRTVINKAAMSNTASLLFQDNFSGRAEFGLTGDDDWHVKVSADGAAWHEALVVDRATGAVSFPNTPMAGGAAVYFLGYADDANASYAEGDIVSLGVDAGNGGADSHSGFAGTANDYYVVQEAGFYFCVSVTNLKAVPAAGRGGLYFARSVDNGATWSNAFKSMANVAADVFGANVAILSLNAGDRVSARCNAPLGGVAQFWSNSRIAMFKIA